MNLTIEKIKKEIITTIYGMESTFRRTTYERDLEMMRRKYIYKDLNISEIIKDIEYLKKLKELK
jgi:hypothetical protein